MNPLEEKTVDCPHCGEYFTVLVDLTLGDQDYIEDCYVCCSPIQLMISIESADILEGNHNEWSDQSNEQVRIITEAAY